jgi:hypothetical protein
MTLEEAIRLRPGDAVEVLSKGAWVPGVVTALPVLYHTVNTDEPYVDVKCSRRGHARRVEQCAHHPDPRHESVRFAPPPLLPGPANVYADWLEDHGHPKAAQLLREAFPLAKEAS